MARLAVFDSGLGSLSIIKAVQKTLKSEIIYFADQKNYPYGHKSYAQLRTIVNKTIQTLNLKFSPDLIIVASNTPTLMLNLPYSNVIGIKPPLDEAALVSESKRIGILGTKSAISSRGILKFIKEKNFSKPVKFFKINGSALVDLVESGIFLTDKQYCKKIIGQALCDVISKNSIDTVTLSSTHLPFLKPLLESEFPNVKFLDPGYIVAESISKIIKNNTSKRNSLKIYTSGNPKAFQNNLSKLKIKNKVHYLSM